MSYIGVKINGLREKIAGMPLMDVAFSNSSRNGLQNKIITAKKDEIEGRLDDLENPPYVEIIADGVKTWGQLFAEVFALADISKLKYNSTIQYGITILPMSRMNKTNDTYEFTNVRLAQAGFYGVHLQYDGDIGFHQKTPTDSTWVDVKNNVGGTGTKVTLYY